MSGARARVATSQQTSRRRWTPGASMSSICCWPPSRHQSARRRHTRRSGGSSWSARRTIPASETPKSARGPRLRPAMSWRSAEIRALRYC
eukprot:2876650-Prymnesium_polylepis.1